MCYRVQVAAYFEKLKVFMHTRSNGALLDFIPRSGCRRISGGSQSVLLD